MLFQKMYQLNQMLSYMKRSEEVKILFEICITLIFNKNKRHLNSVG
jgi:hypothetical protein